MSRMNIVELPLADIHPYERNPRAIEQGVPLVLESIREFGFRNPIIVDKAHTIIAGHTRYAAAQELGMERIPCIVSDMSEEKARAFRIADNKTSEFATWDFEKLEAELAKVEDIDMEAQFGFLGSDSLEKSELFGDKKEPKETEPEYVACPHCGHLNQKP